MRELILYMIESKKTKQFIPPLPLLCCFAALLLCCFVALLLCCFAALLLCCFAALHPLLCSHRAQCLWQGGRDPFFILIYLLYTFYIFTTVKVDYITIIYLGQIN